LTTSSAGWAAQSSDTRRWSAITLTCPKCHGEMRTYERGGVTVDQCGECRGIFLDRGELERLIDAEQSWHTSEQPPRGESYREREPWSEDRGRGYGYGEHSKRRRKKSFLDELFD
jgi:uncharacterized protein